MTSRNKLFLATAIQSNWLAAKETNQRGMNYFSIEIKTLNSISLR